jgi:hypothetical protein
MTNRGMSVHGRPVVLTGRTRHYGRAIAPRDRPPHRSTARSTARQLKPTATHRRSFPSRAKLTFVFLSLV